MQLLGHEMKKIWILIDSWNSCCLFDLPQILCHLRAIPANTSEQYWLWAEILFRRVF